MTTSSTIESIDDWGTTLSDLPPMQDHDDHLPDFDIDLFCGNVDTGCDGVVDAVCGGDGGDACASDVDTLGMPFSSLDTEISSSWNVSFLDEPTTTSTSAITMPIQCSTRKTKRSSTIGKRSTRDHPSHSNTPTPMKRPKSIHLIHRPPSPFEFPYDNDNNTSQVELFDDDDHADDGPHIQVAVHDGSPVNCSDAFDTLSHAHHSSSSPSNTIESGSLPNHVSDDLHLRIQRASDPSLSTRSFVSGSLLCRVATNQQVLPPITGALNAVRRAATLYVTELRGERMQTTSPKPLVSVVRQQPAPMVVMRPPKMRQSNVKGRARKPVANRRVRRKENLTSFSANLPPLALERMPPSPPGALTPLQRYMQSTMA